MEWSELQCDGIPNSWKRWMIGLLATIPLYIYLFNKNNHILKTIFIIYKKKCDALNVMIHESNTIERIKWEKKWHENWIGQPCLLSIFIFLYGLICFPLNGRNIKYECIYFTVEIYGSWSWLKTNLRQRFLLLLVIKRALP